MEIYGSNPFFNCFGESNDKVSISLIICSELVSIYTSNKSYSSTLIGETYIGLSAKYKINVL